jgi:hypothetical protein
MVIEPSQKRRDRKGEGRRAVEAKAPRPRLSNEIAPNRACKEPCNRRLDRARHEKYACLVVMRPVAYEPPHLGACEPRRHTRTNEHPLPRSLESARAREENDAQFGALLQGRKHEKCRQDRRPRARHLQLRIDAERRAGNAYRPFHGKGHNDAEHDGNTGCAHLVLRLPRIASPTAPPGGSLPRR